MANDEFVRVPRADLEYLVGRYDIGSITTVEAANYAYDAFSHVRKWLAPPESAQTEGEAKHGRRSTDAMLSEPVIVPDGKYVLVPTEIWQATVNSDPQPTVCPQCGAGKEGA